MLNEKNNENNKDWNIFMKGAKRCIKHGTLVFIAVVGLMSILGFKISEAFYVGLLVILVFGGIVGIGLALFWTRRYANKD